ncbi:hypothetical protein I7H67_15425 [Acinetobacter sp. ACIN00229]|uniref:hypothetical protein n=1 Tax=Acinetobacter sp. ACIN00229 TaxID=2792607 RepID=UPI0018E05CAA|nr:hypothetical protein [Acinetobacter sp. ACIN00229]MBI0424192.1 hypothetical protein [Acinetobacter sp. ACIN00229]
MANQTSGFLEILDRLGLPEDIKKNLIIAFTIIVGISMLLSVLEKLGIIKLFSLFFSKLFSSQNPTEEDIKVLNELINFENLGLEQTKNKPYALQANLLKELALLNRYFQINLTDIFTLRFLFTREEPKRAKRLYSPKLDKYIEKSGDRYILKKKISFWVVWIPLCLWIAIYCYSAYFLLDILFSSREFKNGEPIAFLYYVCIVIVVFIIAGVTSFLLRPWQAKIFTQLKSSNPKLRLQRKIHKKIDN